MQRIIVKLGTNVIMRADGPLAGKVALGLLCGIVEQIAALRARGIEVLVVSSGAIGLGVERLGLSARPTALAEIQACAAIGQSRLMALYDDAFDRLGCRIAQVLLTEDDFRDPVRHRNLRATLDALLTLGVIPIVNENDTVSTLELDRPLTSNRVNNEVGRQSEYSMPLVNDEQGERPGNSLRPGQFSDLEQGSSRPLRVASSEQPERTESTERSERLFGDNDKLSAILLEGIDADLLILLSDVDGLYTGHPSDPAAKVLRHVATIDDRILALAHGGNGRGRGGMLSKLESARIALAAGKSVVIANGRTPDVLERILAGEPIGTRFGPPAPISPIPALQTAQLAAR